MGRAVISSVCVMACVLVVCYRGQIASTIARESADTVVAETDALGDASSPSKRDAMLLSITAFRAYAELAYERAEFYNKQHKSGDTAIVNLMIDFAKSGVEAIAEAKSTTARDKAHKAKAMEGMDAHTKALMDEVDFALVHAPGAEVDTVKAAKDSAGCDSGAGGSWCETAGKCVGVDETCPDAHRKFNVVVDFAKALTQAKQRFTVGVNKYILDNMHDAIMKGETVVV